ncbi:MAG: hypothetical protein CMJ18_13670 [Phycisphaeraceae bacterium]|nr:hypothetical protein [Phycisphaeraceae bacterium]
MRVEPGAGVDGIDFGNRRFTIFGDLTLDWRVGLDDLQMVLAHFTYNVDVGDVGMGDATGPDGMPDGIVGSHDLMVVLANFMNEVDPVAAPLDPWQGWTASSRSAGIGRSVLDVIADGDEGDYLGGLLVDRVL